MVRVGVTVDAPTSDANGSATYDVAAAVCRAATRAALAGWLTGWLAYGSALVVTADGPERSLPPSWTCPLLRL